MTRKKWIAAASVSIVAAVTVTSASPRHRSPEGAWTQEEMKLFWHIDQGSRLMSLKVFNALETSPGRLLVDDLEKFNFIPDPAPEGNPPYLPIGFAKSNGDSPDSQVGMTCSACHTSSFLVNGTKKIIEGAPALLDFNAFFEAVVKAVDTTVNDSDAWDRFKARTNFISNAEIVALLNKLKARQRINTPTVIAGPARLDALGAILNQVAITGLGNDESYAITPNAPASFPCLWDISQHRYVQWNGSAPNLGVEGVGSYLRNVGEVLGVFGDLTIPQKPHVALLGKAFGSEVRSSVVPGNLVKIESLISRLRSPEWPFDNGPLSQQTEKDKELGEHLYVKNCEECHKIIKRDHPNNEYPLPVKMRPVGEVQTDRREIDEFVQSTAPTKQLNGLFKTIIPRKFWVRFGPEAPMGEIVAAVAAGSVATDSKAAGISLAQIIGSFVRVFALSSPDVEQYKARPLNGVWATAPYLHNGSVSNLAELLKLPSARFPAFCMGTYDSQLVGYRPEPPSNCAAGTVIDTSIYGNTNSGHLYGTRLSDTEKNQLLEFLKRL
jgi:hypothetical protein